MRIRWRGLELPTRLHAERETLTDTYGKFVAEPFEKGFGHTIGNSLRRVLRSSLEGSAVTELKMGGVHHEIMSIPGVVEDVTEIVLSVKSLVVKNLSEEPRVIKIDRHEKGVIKAADIEHDELVQIINPEHVIATLTDDVPFSMEMKVENGRGYEVGSERQVTDREIGVIPLDASFSPVGHVKYEVEETRIGQRTNFDRLVIEIWTNGVVTAQMALVEASKILRKHLNPFIQYSEPGPEMPLEDEATTVQAPADGLDAETERKLNMSLAELELSVRATNCLETEGITTVRDLVMRSENELLEVRNFGDTTLTEVQEKLAERGLELGMKVPSAAQ